ncbi:nucleoporin GLE1 [Cyclopterus lumpus]|uniref:mRNA export factor GLE1 n=1 Tax=Cyclopterus lumpus TaxID=8103 RepID=A0A8C2XDP7_CYCLU|nr:nucleoporin GLE1 [Cyclopterus lumpus]
MPAENLRWETLRALKNSSKGQIKFDPYWSERGEDILAGCKEALSLSPQSGVILERLASFPLQKSCFLSSSSGGSSPGLFDENSASLSSSGSVSDLHAGRAAPSAAASLNAEREQAVVDEAKDEDAEEDVGDVHSPASPPAISLLSPKAMETDGRIIKFEEEQREKAKMALKRRQEMHERLVAVVASSESEQLKRFEEFMELKQRQEFQSMRDMMDRETKESIGRQEKLKEEQRHRMKIINLRLREAEQQRLREAELQRQRQADGRERLRNLNSIQEEILQLNQLMEPSTQTSLGSYCTRGNQLCSQLSEVVRKTAEGEFPSMEDMTVAERALHEMRALMQEEVAKAQDKKKRDEEQEEQRRKQEELQALQEAQKKAAAESAKEKAKRKGLQNSAEEGTLKWFKELQESAARCAQAFEQLNAAKDAQAKKLKLELQKAASIPVCQISSNSGSQLRDIFNRLDKLLAGRAVVSGGRNVCTSQHPQGLDFVSFKLAEKFVKQGEEEVASHHEAAFPIAVVASGIWEVHPRVGELILAHLHKKCPYAVPHYPPMKDGTTVDDYQRILGYRVDDSGVEGQDSFLKRMSGMIRLYAAIIQLRWPYGSKQGAAPHGLNHGWRWLAQMLNMEPLADITATLLFDFLEVCGHALMKQYQSQFWKLILLLKEEYFPRIEAVASSGQMGSVIRLQQFLETSLQSRQIRPPKGQLTSMFWGS